MEILTNLLQEAKKHLIQHENHLAIEKAEKSLEFQKSPAVYKILAVCHLRQKNIERSIECAKEGIELLKSQSSEDSSELNFQLNLCLAKAFKVADQLDKAKDLLNSLLLLGHETGKISEYILELNKSEDLKMFQKKNKPKIDSPGKKFFIVSASWFENWFKFHTKQTENLPGDLINFDLIEFPAKDFLVFHDWPESQNLLKPGLKEEVDYKIVSEEAYKILTNGVSIDYEILRMSSESGGLGEVTVEVQIPIRRIMFLGVESAHSCKTFAASRTRLLNEIKEAVLEEISDKVLLGFDDQECTIWKYPENETEPDLDPTEDKIYLPEATFLQFSRTLAENKVAPSDILIFELPKDSQQWTISKSQVQKCENCSSTKNLECCSRCKKVKYCSRVCQTTHYPTHSKHCTVVATFSSSRAGKVGLQNLGNTCFMNSGLQCLSNCKPLTDYFVSGKYRQDLNYDNPLGTKGAQLAMRYAELVKELWTGSSSTVSPWEFKTCLSRFASQFSGFQQHDSQEFLSFLLSGLHEDLNRVKKKEYVETPDQGEKSDFEYAELIWNLFLKRNQSIIVDCMYGQLKSTVICPHCSRKSTTFDPFLTLSATLLASESLILNIYLYPANNEIKPKNFKIELMKNSPFGLVKRKLEEKHRCKLICYSISKLSFFRFLQDDEKAGNLPGTIIACFESPENIQDFYPIPLNLKKIDQNRQTIASCMPCGIPRMLFLEKKASSLAIFEKIKEFLHQTFKESKISPPESYSDLLNEPVFKIKTSKPRVFCEFCKSKCEGCELGLSADLSMGKIKEVFEGFKQQSIVLDLELSKTLSLVVLNLPCESSNLNLLETKKLNINYCLEMAKYPEILDEENKWYCGTCKDHVRASKQMDVFKFPKILVIHLLRFKKKGYWTEKNTEFVDFPVENLVLDSITEKQVKFNLFAISNHYGGTGGGHYTAFVKNGETWFEMDDSRVSTTTAEKIVSSSAYLLFYERVN